MKKTTKKITPITGYGTTGYSVTFSVLDIYKMKQLAHELNQLGHVVFESKGDTKATYSLDMACELLKGLFEATIGETNGCWDCFTEEESL